MWGSNTLLSLHIYVEHEKKKNAALLQKYYSSPLMSNRNAVMRSKSVLFSHGGLSFSSSSGRCTTGASLFTPRVIFRPLFFLPLTGLRLPGVVIPAEVARSSPP